MGGIGVRYLPVVSVSVRIVSCGMGVPRGRIFHM